MLYNGKLKEFGVVAILFGGLLLSLLSVFGSSANIPLYWTPLTALDWIKWCGVSVAVYLAVWAGYPAGKNLVFLALCLCYMVIGIGVVGFVAIFIFLLSALFLGVVVLDSIAKAMPSSQPIAPALLTGVGIFVAVFGVLIHVHANTRELYWIVVATPLLFMFPFPKNRKLVSQVCSALSAKVVALNRAPSLFFLFAVMVFICSARYSFFPSVGYDDNAGHLRMWTELRTSGVFSFDVKSQIWSVAPFTIDLLHAVTSLMADSDSRSALDFILFALLVFSVNELASRFVPNLKDRLLIIALFCSTPMIANLLISLQTELLLALIVTSGASCIYLLKRDDIIPSVVGVAFAAALACSIKVPGVVLGAMLVIGLCSYGFAIKPLVTVKFGVRQVSIVALLFALVCFVALHPYLNAWLITKNPVFPLYNAIFKSEYFPLRNFSDQRYQLGFSVGSYLEAFFKTSKYFESNDFTAGFQYLLMLPLALLMTVASKQRAKYLPVVSIVIGFGVIMFSATQYWRYLFPVFPVASVVIGILLAEFSVAGKVGKIFARGIIVAIIGLNVYFLPGVSWLFITPLQSLYSSAGKQAAMVDFAPAKRIVDYINLTAPGSTVLFDPTSPSGATLDGRSIYPIWYSPVADQKYSQLRTVTDVSNWMREDGVQFIVWGLRSTEQHPSRDLIRNYLAEFGVPVYQANGWVLYRLTTTEVQYSKTVDIALSSGARTKDLMFADEKPNPVSAIETNGAASARYSVSYTCESDSGYFVAQVNWDKPPVYYKLLPCSGKPLSFVESMSVPVGAKVGEVYLTSSGTKKVLINALKIEFN